MSFLDEIYMCAYSLEYLILKSWGRSRKLVHLDFLLKVYIRLNISKYLGSLN